MGPALRAGAVLVGVLVLAIAPLLGSVTIPPELVGRILLHGLTLGTLPASPCSGVGVSPRLCSAYSEILWNERVPEILLALLAGAALGISGATLQGVFRNPLADPYLLGLSTGGTLGASLLLIFRFGLADADLLLPLFAFAGAVLTGAAILVVARGPRGSNE
ncbi:MAG TPA: iron chelate uptake ABC transporter family permease subunit, partial [Thermoplasmata archaeon]|nr:iron chelate uptake ABC transporter family permease subunit [Thermoplasmata archaeon]